MRNILIICLVMFSSGLALGQIGTKIKGRVINLSTQQPVAFANVGVEGTFIGAASDSDGYFEFSVPKSEQSKKIYFSAIGFQLIKRTFAQVNQENLVIKMSPQAYSLDGVDVNAQSRVIFRVLKKASAAIQTNYISTPFIYNFTFRSEEYVNNVQKKSLSSEGEIYDQKGYKRSNVAEAFKSRHYRFTKYERNNDALYLSEGQDLMDDLLTFDIARLYGNILDTPYLNDYDLSLEKESEFNGQKVWVISYNLSKPDLARTGDSHATQYAGRVYINKADHAILKNETWVSTNDKHYQGRTIREEQKHLLNTEYKFITIYKKDAGGKYRLAHINYNRKGLNNKNGNKLLEIGNLSISKSELNPDSHFTGRVYFSKNR